MIERLKPTGQVCRPRAPPPLELPCGETPDVNVELVEPWVAAITGELDLELHSLT
jgi:hypothetical protein